MRICICISTLFVFVICIVLNGEKRGGGAFRLVVLFSKPATLPTVYPAPHHQPVPAQSKEAVR